ncbi:hypothetical protein CVT24_010193 [Panaeolus cyanescens]|uniref:Uncharacterized protein n=1 Tax=Panaeolus cyanescens TaxID=181874 RepID=A0A409YPY4_9AGAR|nr:hypothetical protein CVT24_010193 [Panaeolus cyanescens]
MSHKLIVLGKDQIEKGFNIAKFENTQASAIEILQTVSLYDNGLTEVYNRAEDIVFAELLERIGNAYQRRQSLQEERTQLLTDPNPKLDDILLADFRDVDKRLVSNIHRLATYKFPPHRLCGDVRGTAYQYLRGITLSSEQFVRDIEAALTLLSSSSESTQPSRRHDLEETLLAARMDVQAAYSRLLDFGLRPPGFEPFVPTISFPVCSSSKLAQTSTPVYNWRTFPYQDVGDEVFQQVSEGIESPSQQGHPITPGNPIDLPLTHAEGSQDHGIENSSMGSTDHQRHSPTPIHPISSSRSRDEGSQVHSNAHDTIEGSNCDESLLSTLLPFFALTPL